MKDVEQAPLMGVQKTLEPEVNRPVAPSGVLENEIAVSVGLKPVAVTDTVSPR